MADEALGMSLDEIIAKNRKEKKPRPKPNKPQQKGPKAPIVKSLSTAADRLTVSNLGPNVTEKDVRDLFARIGPVKKASLNYNHEGKSKGIATVEFKTPGDAHKAFTEYHNRPLDDRPMKIELLVNPESVKVKTVLEQKVGNAGINKRRKPMRKNKGPKKDVSAMDLDAEMDTYMSESAPAQSLAAALS